MGWNGMTGNNGEGFHATEQELIAAVQKKNAERELPAAEDVTPLRSQIEEYAASLSEKEAAEDINFCLSVAESDGYLPQLLNWIQENGFQEAQDVRIQAAALEYGKNFFSM